MLPCIAKEANLKQTTLNCKLCIELSSQLFYSLSVMLSYKNSIGKAPKLLVIFVGALKGHAILS